MSRRQDSHCIRRPKLEVIHVHVTHMAMHRTQLNMGRLHITGPEDHPRSAGLTCIIMHAYMYVLRKFHVGTIVARHHHVIQTSTNRLKKARSMSIPAPPPHRSPIQIWIVSDLKSAPLEDSRKIVAFVRKLPDQFGNRLHESVHITNQASVPQN